MADNTAPTTQEYNNTGFADASGVDGLQQQANQIKIDNASLRQQAEAQYKQTYDIQQRSLSGQLSALIKTQTDDSDLLNKQYEQSVNTMMSKLAKRGLNIGSTPDSTVAALNKYQNNVMDQRKALYGVQRLGVQNMIDTLKKDYDLNIRARMATNRSNALASLNEIMAQIAKLQTSSYEDYIKYLLTRNDLINQRKGLENDLVGLEGQKLRLKGDVLAYGNQQLGLEGDALSLEGQKLRLKGDELGHEGQKLRLKGDELGYENQKLRLEGAQLGLEGDKLDFANKKLQLKGKGSSGGSGRRGGSSGSSQTIPSATPSNSLGAGYFAGNGTSGSSSKTSWIATTGSKIKAAQDRSIITKIKSASKTTKTTGFNKLVNRNTLT